MKRRISFVLTAFMVLWLLGASQNVIQKTLYLLSVTSDGERSKADTETIEMTFSGSVAWVTKSNVSLSGAKITSVEARENVLKIHIRDLMSGPDVVVTLKDAKTVHFNRATIRVNVHHIALSISGAVLGSPGVLVSLKSDTSVVTVKCSDEGLFRFENVTSGYYEVTVAEDGYTSRHVMVIDQDISNLVFEKVPTDPSSSPLGTQENPIELLTEAVQGEKDDEADYEVSGKVTDELGRGLAASVVLKDKSEKQVVNPTYADKEGNFTLSNVPGRQEVILYVKYGTYEDYESSPFEVTQNTDGIKVCLNSGGVNRENTKQPPTYAVRGKIKLEDNASPTGVVVQLKNERDERVGTAVGVDKNGSFSFDKVSEGTSYTLKVYCSGYYSYTSRSFDIKDADIDTFMIVLKPVEVVTFHVTYEAADKNSGLVPVDDKAYTEGEAVTVCANVLGLSKIGHKFAGWKNSLDGRVYSPGQSFVISKDCKLTVCWVSDTASFERPEDYVAVEGEELTLGLQGDAGTENPMTGDTRSVFVYPIVLVSLFYALHRSIRDAIESAGKKNDKDLF
jgi:hypothetical protein